MTIIRGRLLHHQPTALEHIYSRRFDAHVTYRNEVWKVLTSRFFGRFIDPHATVLDLGCGYGEFINNIQCAKKFAMDLNPRSRQYLGSDVCFVQQDCSARWDLGDETLDAVFTSNFFEHLPTREALAAALAEAQRCLRKGGRIIALGPNAKYVGGAYWDFWDHQIALTERSMKEVLDLQGFDVETVIDRFLPYTMANTRRYTIPLVALYLKIHVAWKFFGKQFLVIARKSG